MKAKPVKLVDGFYVTCSPEEATHVEIRMPLPEPLTTRLIPVYISGAKPCSPCWKWNGDTASPTLSPSVLTQLTYADRKLVCHSFVDEGRVRFLPDSTHAKAGRTFNLNEVTDD